MTGIVPAPVATDSLLGVGPQVPPARQSAEKRARETARQFETMFVTQMLEHMSSGLKADGNFGGGGAETIHRSMLNEEYAKQIVKRGGIGIADGIYREMLRMQEMQP
jgi:Rod binding domain-containing protein